jgi:Cys-rich protein (TIGR01571 family)
MGQVMQRLRLDWLGRPTTEYNAKNTFKLCAVVFAAYYIYTNFLFPPQIYQYGSFMYIMRSFGHVLFVLWTVYALSNTRAFVRAKYQIREEIYPGYEDVGCALLCPCCTVAQIARHTGEYETYPSVCISETGLPQEAPMLV